MFEQTGDALYGRDELLAVLGDFTRSASGRSALLLGDRGSGKTALLAAAADIARTAGVTVVPIVSERDDSRLFTDVRPASCCGPSL